MCAVKEWTDGAEGRVWVGSRMVCGMVEEIGDREQLAAHEENWLWGLCYGYDLQRMVHLWWPVRADLVGDVTSGKGNVCNSVGIRDR